MGILSWILMGLIVGVIGKLVMPGPDPGGIFLTILLGIGGAFVGGYVGSFLGLGSVTGLNPGSLLLSFRYSSMDSSTCAGRLWSGKNTGQSLPASWPC